MAIKLKFQNVLMNKMCCFSDVQNKKYLDSEGECGKRMFRPVVWITFSVNYRTAFGHCFARRIVNRFSLIVVNMFSDIIVIYAHIENCYLLHHLMR